MTHGRALLLDLDGTLIDSFPGIARAYRHVLNEMDLGDMEDSAIKQFIGPPIQEVLERQFQLSGPRLAKGITIFRSHYGSEGLFDFTIYPGINEMIGSLTRADFTLCIATSKLTHMANEILERAGWSEDFLIVGGALPDGTRHLKTDVVGWTIGQLSPSQSAVAMVGDRAADISGGNAHGLAGIGVGWGYGETDELAQAGATAIADTPEQLINIVHGFVS
jgi:phosphoglycolate phosphatase